MNIHLIGHRTGYSHYHISVPASVLSLIVFMLLGTGGHNSGESLFGCHSSIKGFRAPKSSDGSLGASP